MSTSTGVFYAFARNINTDWSGRYLIAFANRDVADTWHRTVIDSVAQGYPKFASVKRTALQWYTYNPDVGSITDTVNDSKVALALRGQIFFTLLNDREHRILSTIPVLNYRDHINGASFYIRSVSQPDIYWFYNAAEMAVVASRHRRTRFTITIADRARAPGTIIIGSDDVYITTPSGANVGVANSLDDQLSRSANPFPFRFSAFHGDFQIDESLSESLDPGLEPIVRNPGKGETWDLV
ncbi:hypothetical protein FRB96_001346 [Tulasnella sp. 330]|nr:hypothetical protein FRB96_001346 [Tulasnella sp. 330]